MYNTCSFLVAEDVEIEEEFVANTIYTQKREKEREMHDKIFGKVSHKLFSISKCKREN